MARIFPFQPYRYSPRAGRLSDLVTQPYDKISPEMRARYLARSPHNLVRIILGERLPGDDSKTNVYTRAAGYLSDWMAGGILVRDQEPCLLAYFQDFCVPDTGERLSRRGFIGLGAVEDYSAGVVHRHEQTLSGPKQDRLELLRHTHAHFGQIFMLYPDPERAVDRLLEESAQAAPDEAVVDEYGAEHRVWKISDPARISAIRGMMADKKLLIADGHHRYETALAFRNENPGLEGAARVMMTFVNMYSPGLKILATHRLVSGLANFDAAEFLSRAGRTFEVEEVRSPDELQGRWQGTPRGTLGAAIGGQLYLLRLREPSDQLDVPILHEMLLGGVLGISEEAVRAEKNLHYVRGLDKAIEAARRGEAQIAFLLRATSIEDVTRISFSGGVMPQKSTDFYPKLLSGLTIYKVDG
ncbi:MAG TPA: DUF1015 domain-containing protein [Bryobacteraceae bacterium]|nr:DUF1015 domain-containing protein [Bryobacteraceae bacterium]